MIKYHKKVLIIFLYQWYWLTLIDWFWKWVQTIILKYSYIVCFTKNFQFGEKNSHSSKKRFSLQKFLTTRKIFPYQAKILKTSKIFSQQEKYFHTRKKTFTAVKQFSQQEKNSHGSKKNYPGIKKKSLGIWEKFTTTGKKPKTAVISNNITCLHIWNKSVSSLQTELINVSYY